MAVKRCRIRRAEPYKTNKAERSSWLLLGSSQAVSERWVGKLLKSVGILAGAESWWNAVTNQDLWLYQW